MYTNNKKILVIKNYFGEMIADFLLVALLEYHLSEVIFITSPVYYMYTRGMLGVSWVGTFRLGQSSC
jgi:hypothetical protein